MTITGRVPILLLIGVVPVVLLGAFGTGWALGTLAAWIGTRLVGSVRVGLEADRALLGRLAVAPDLQGRGIGTKLIMSVLGYLPEDTKEVWVFTGQDSKQNLALYDKHGFEHQYDQNAGDLTYAYLRKILGDDEGDDTATDEN